VVLLVEDDQVLREVTGEMLIHMGFTVLEAKDGVKAVEVFREHEEQKPYLERNPSSHPKP
jgi:CheY-like chemotaxis protein